MTPRLHAPALRTCASSQPVQMQLLFVDFFCVHVCGQPGEKMLWMEMQDYYYEMVIRLVLGQPLWLMTLS